MERSAHICCHKDTHKNHRGAVGESLDNKVCVVSQAHAGPIILLAIKSKGYPIEIMPFLQKGETFWRELLVLKKIDSTEAENYPPLRHHPSSSAQHLPTQSSSLLVHGRAVVVATVM